MLDKININYEYEKRIGPSTDPGGTPDSISAHSDCLPFKTVLCLRPDNEFSIQS